MAEKYSVVLLGRKGVDINMLVIKFSVYNSRLRRINSTIVPLCEYGYLKVEFDFRTEDWDKIENKTVNFYYNGQNYSVELDENNQCFVPEEVIYAPSFKVFVAGGDITTNSISIFLEGDTNIVPDAYEEIMKLIREHTHEEYLEDDEVDEILPDSFDAGVIIERS